MIQLTIFNELDYGIDENKPEVEVVERIGTAALEAWEQRAIVPDGWNVDPVELIQNWKNFALDVLEHHSGKTIMVVTSNGIVRFAPYLTDHYPEFVLQHSLKVSTGGLCVFEHDSIYSAWQCKDWNIRPT